MNKSSSKLQNVFFGKDVRKINEDDNPICTTNIFSTILDVVGADVSEIHDSKSFTESNDR